MPINTVEFDLSLVNPDTGEYLTARTYTVEGVNNVDGTPRQLSIGQLVMAICLQRASRLENGYTDPVTNQRVKGIIDLMEEMNATSVQLEIMTRIEEEVLAGTVNLDTASVTYNGVPYTYRNFLTNVMQMTNVPTSASAASSDFITALESKMDEKNSFSQQTMIELQSMTSKRDQAYDMVSNVLKSLNTVQVGIVNNF